MESGSFRLITGIPKLKASNITDVLAARIASAFSKKEFTLPFTTSSFPPALFVQETIHDEFASGWGFKSILILALEDLIKSVSNSYLYSIS